MSRFAARHVQRSHTIVLNGVPEVVFPLFTPAGEKLWVDDWDPVYLYPSSGETREGMVFSTGHDDETTYWSLVTYDPRGTWRAMPASRRHRDLDLSRWSAKTPATAKLAQR